MVVNNLNSFESKEQTVKDLMDLPVGEQEGFISPQEHYLLTLERQREIIKKEIKDAIKNGHQKVKISVFPYDIIKSELFKIGWKLDYRYQEGYTLEYDEESIRRSLQEPASKTYGGGCEVE